MLPSIPSSPPPRIGAPHSRQSKGTGGRGDRARSLAEDDRREIKYFLTSACDVDENTLRVALSVLSNDTTVHVLAEAPRLVDRVVLWPASAASVESLAALPVQDVFAISGGNLCVSAAFLPALVGSLEEGEPPQLRDFLLTMPDVVSRAQPLVGLIVGVCADVNWCSRALLSEVVLAAGARSIDEASSSCAFDVLLSDAPRRGARVLDCQAFKLAVLTGRLPPHLPLLEFSSVARAERSSSSVVQFPALDSERTADVASPEEAAPAEDDETVVDDGGPGGQLVDPSTAPHTLAVPHYKLEPEAYFFAVGADGGATSSSLQIGSINVLGRYCNDAVPDGAYRLKLAIDQKDSTVSRNHCTVCWKDGSDGAGPGFFVAANKLTVLVRAQDHACVVLEQGATEQIRNGDTLVFDAAYMAGDGLGELASAALPEGVKYAQRFHILSAARRELGTRSAGVSVAADAAPTVADGGDDVLDGGDASESSSESSAEELTDEQKRAALVAGLDAARRLREAGAFRFQDVQDIAKSVMSAGFEDLGVSALAKKKDKKREAELGRRLWKKEKSKKLGKDEWLPALIEALEEEEANFEGRRLAALLEKADAAAKAAAVDDAWAVGQETWT